MWLDEIFKSKPIDFYCFVIVIEQLVDHQQEIVNNEGEYIVE